MKQALIKATAILTCCATVGVANTALACWNGYSVTVGRTTIEEGTRFATWRPEQAKFRALWARRIDALLPAGVTLVVGHGSVDCKGHSGCAGLSVPATATVGDIFVAVADAFGVKGTARATAAATSQPVYTVQVFAGTKTNALAFRDKINALSPLDTGESFYAVGGFPANKPVAHAVADTSDPSLVRVVIEQYLDAATAQAAEKRLRAQGIDGFVELLPEGATIDDPVCTSEG